MRTSARTGALIKETGTRDTISKMSSWSLCARHSNDRPFSQAPDYHAPVVVPFGANGGSSPDIRLGNGSQSFVQTVSPNRWHGVSAALRADPSVRCSNLSPPFRGLVSLTHLE